MKKQAVLSLGDARLDKVKLQFEMLSKIKGGDDDKVKPNPHDLTIDVDAETSDLIRGYDNGPKK